MLRRVDDDLFRALDWELESGEDSDARELLVEALEHKSPAISMLLSTPSTAPCSKPSSKSSQTTPSWHGRSSPEEPSSFCSNAARRRLSSALKSAN
jgi:hypothetical protein